MITETNYYVCRYNPNDCYEAGERYEYEFIRDSDNVLFATAYSPTEVKQLQDLIEKHGSDANFQFTYPNWRVDR